MISFCSLQKNKSEE